MSSLSLGSLAGAASDRFLNFKSEHSDGIAIEREHWRGLGAKSGIACLITAIAACGGNQAGPAPVPSSVLPRVASGIVGCPIVRATPRDGSAAVFVNALISVTYKAPSPRQCGPLNLVDSNGATVATETIYSNEWASPIDGVIGAMTLVPNSDLAPGAQYRIFLAGNLVGTFQTGASNIRRGTYVTASDENAGIDYLPSAPVVTASNINSSLRSVVTSYVKNDRILADALVAALGLDVPHLVNPGAQYNAHIKKLTYNSTKADGTPVVLSGLLVYPEHIDGSSFDYSKARLVMWEHGSRASTDPAPPSSAAGYDLMLNVLSAGRGYISFEPDLIGLGDTAATQPQSYLIAQDTGTASQDLLLAVRDYFSRSYSGVQLNPGLILAGASQGAFSSFAALPYVSGLADVTGVYAADGPYNIFQTLSSNLFALAGAPRDAYSQNEDVNFVASNLRNILDAYSANEGFSYVASNIFLSNGSLAGTFIQDYVQSKYPDLVFHAGLNSMVGSSVVYNAPKANVVLFHYSGDTYVPAQNTADMIGFLSNGTHRLASVNRGDCHENSLFVSVFLNQYKNSEATHIVCGLFFLDRVVGDL